MYSHYGGRYNVMVINMAWNPSFVNKSPPGHIAFHRFDYYGCIFGVYTFVEGEFHNEGDGGLINWCWHGDNFERRGNGGKHVVFRPTNAWRQLQRQ